MIDCAGLVFSVRSARANSFRQQADASYVSPDKCGLERRAENDAHSSIAYLTSPMHDG
jgi:hypothetical protein